MKPLKIAVTILAIVALWVLVADRALALVPDRSQLDPTQTRCITRCANDAAPPLADGSQPYGEAGTIVAVHDPQGGLAATAVPAPEGYADYAPAPAVLILAVSAVGTICPAPLDQASLTCDPYSFARWNPGAVLSAGGYVTRFGVRFYWVDAGLNVFGGHDYGWLDSRAVQP
jgi:hypothetical protein